MTWYDRFVTVVLLPMLVPGHSLVADFRRGKARYRPLARLAAGGMAEVWRGEAQLADGRIEPVAIKRVLPTLAGHEQYKRMFEDEARLGMLLRHPNIVRVYDARELEGSFIMIMELIEGVSLRELFAQQQRRGQALPVGVSLHIARELARALGYAHEAIDEWGRKLCLVHRDVSPHNVLLGTQGEVKLMDFGLANASSNLADRDPRMLGGKFGYLSPELVTHQQASPLLDLFALGVILWECITGARLFQGKGGIDPLQRVAACQVPRPSSFNPALSSDLEQVILGLLERDPARRYQSARELGADLDLLLAEGGYGEHAPHDTAQLVQRDVAPARPRPARATAAADGFPAVAIRHSRTRPPRGSASVSSPPRQLSVALDQFDAESRP